MKVWRLGKDRPRAHRIQWKKMVLIRREILSFLLKSKNPAWKGKKIEVKHSYIKIIHIYI